MPKPDTENVLVVLGKLLERENDGLFGNFVDCASLGEDRAVDWKPHLVTELALTTLGKMLERAL